MCVSVWRMIRSRSDAIGAARGIYRFLYSLEKGPGMGAAGTVPDGDGGFMAKSIYLFLLVRARRNWEPEDLIFFD